MNDNMINFLDFLLPGDPELNVPAFSQCDDRALVDSFVQSLPKDVVTKVCSLNYYDDSPNEALKKLKEKGVDARPMINSTLSFYFSRPSVVVPLTKRAVPLTTSGVSTY